jgi:hypothetical protein
MLLFLALLYSSFTVIGQPSSLVKQWDRSYGGIDGDFLYQLLPTPDGGFLATGISQSNQSLEKSDDNWDPSSFPSYDCWVIKCDENATVQWDRTLGGSSDEFLYSVINTSDGGFLVLCATRSPASGNITQPPIGTFDMWAVKLSSNGGIDWEHRYGGSDNNGGGDMVELSGGGFLIGGYTTSPVSGDVSEPSYGSADYWILRVDAAGNKLWDKRYGGNDSESISRIFKTDDGGFLLAGGSVSNTSGLKTQDLYVNGKSDLWFVRIDSSGNFLWDKQIGSLENDYSLDMIATTDQHYLMAVSTDAGIGADKTKPTNGITDFWMFKTDTLLNIVWDQSIGGTGHEDDFGNIFETAQGTYLIAGTSYSAPNFWKTIANNGPENTWIVMVDSAGNKMWDKTILTGYTHCELGLGIQLNGGCYLFANDGDGMVADEKTDMSYGFDYWCIKYCDTLLQQPPVSAVSFGASDTDICEKFCISFFDSSLNNPTSWQWEFPGGNPSSSADQNPGPVCYDNPGDYDVTLITSGATGPDTLVLAGYIHVSATPVVPTITQNGTLLTSSPSITYQWQFNAVDVPGATNQSFTATQTGFYTILTGNAEGCISSQTIYILMTGMDEAIKRQQLTISPNPSSGIFNLSLADIDPGEIELAVLNSMGLIIYQKVEMITSSQAILQLDLGSIGEGSYQLRIKAKRGIVNGKLLIQR